MIVNNLLICADLNQDNNLSKSSQEELIEEDVDNSNNTSSLNKSIKNYVHAIEIMDAVPAFKKYIETHGKLPDTVKVGDKTLSTVTFTRYMAIIVSRGTTVKSTLSRFYVNKYYVKPHKLYEVHVYCNRFGGNDAYVDLAKAVNNFLDRNLKTPLSLYNDVGEIKFNISYEVYSYAFACAINYMIHDPNNSYPKNLLFTSKPFLGNVSGLY